jgi:hypothetical protein
MAGWQLNPATGGGVNLNIDFAPRRQRDKRPWLGLSLGTASLSLLFALAWPLGNESAAGLHFSPENPLLEESTQGLNKAIDDLNFPWLAVLTLLEENTGPDLRLGQMEADSRSARLTLQGEARNQRLVLALPDNLRKNPLVSEARIISQSTATSGESQEFPTCFALEIQFSLAAGR